MIYLYRISKTSFVNDLSGTGAKLYGGRWNEKGIPLIYTSGCSSLGMLECVVHFPVPFIPPSFSLALIEAPDDIHDISSIGTLPVTWRENPPTAETQTFIKNWIQDKPSLILKVPSAVNPEEYNYLINQAKRFNLLKSDFGNVWVFSHRTFILPL